MSDPLQDPEVPEEMLPLWARIAVWLARAKPRRHLAAWTDLGVRPQLVVEDTDEEGNIVESHTFTLDTPTDRQK